MQQLPQPLHALIRAHLSLRDGLALAAASTELLDLHRLGARHLTLRARPPTTLPALPALASLLARQHASALRGLRVRVLEGGATACPAAAAAVDDGHENPMPTMPMSVPPDAAAWPAAAGPPTGAGDLMLISDEESVAEADVEDGLLAPAAPAPAPAAALTSSMLFPPPLELPPLPCLPGVETLVLEAAEEGDDDEAADGDDEEGRRVRRDNTLHATLSAVLLCPSTNPNPTPARASLTSGLLSALLAPGVLPSLRTLVLDGKDMLDERGLERLGQAFEQCGPRPVPLTTLALEPPSLTQGRGLARLLLSGACDGLEQLTLRRVNALGMSAVARYLGCPQHSGRLRSLALYRREGHLAWADPVAEALAAGGAPCLEALHLSFFPFGSQAADAFIRHRLVLHPLRELRLTAAGLREHDLVNLLLPPAPAPAPSLARLRVLRLDFRRAPAAVLAHALRSGSLPALETLGLVHCRLGDAGAGELAEALAFAGAASSVHRTPGLKCLDLAFNGINADGARALARWCLPLPALEHLRLDGNPLGDAGAMCLVEALRPSACIGSSSKRGATTAAATAAGALHHAAAGAAAPPALDTLFIPDGELLHACGAGRGHHADGPASATKLRRLELRRVQLGRSAVRALVQALLAGGAPELRSLVLGTPHIPGGATAMAMAAGGDGSNGYVEAGALDAATRQLLRAGRPGLRVSQEAGSLFMGLV